jgi:hypothetical protein
VTGQVFEAANADWQELLSEIKSKNGTSITSILLNFKDATVAYKRGMGASDVFDAMHISPAHNNHHSPQVGMAMVRISDYLSKALKAVDPGLAIGGAEVAAQRKLEALHASTLQRLEGVASDLIKRQAAHAAELDSGFVARRKTMDDELSAQRASLEKLDEARRLEHEAKLKTLRARETDLDDRANRHARREDYKAMRAKIIARQSDFSLTSGTRRLRWPVHLMAVILLAVFGWLTWWFSSQTLEALKSASAASNLRIDAVYAILRSAALATAFAGTAIFYLRWLNVWAERHSEAEFQLRKLELDIDRASWVVEAALEWDTQVQKPMPDALLEGITRNLFEPISGTGKSKDDNMDPADQLASALLGSANAKVKLKNDGNYEIDLEPGKLGKAKNW